MAITTYDELKTAIANWLARTDLTTEIDDFIDIAEAEFNRKLRISDMESTTTLTTTTTSSLLSLPSDLKQIKTLEHTGGNPLRIEQVTQQFLINTSNGSASTSGRPNAYSLYPGNRIQLAPQPDSALTLTLSYFQQIPALSSGSTTNWLLQRAPDAYLYTSLAAAVGFIQDTSKLQLWKSLGAGAIDEIKKENEVDKVQEQGIRPRPPVNRP